MQTATRSSADAPGRQRRHLLKVAPGMPQPAQAEAAGLRFIGPIQIDPTSLLTPPDPHKAQVAAEVALAIESALLDAARAAATLEAALIGPRARKAR